MDLAVRLGVFKNSTYTVVIRKSHVRIQVEAKNSSFFYLSEHNCGCKMTSRLKKMMTTCRYFLYLQNLYAKIQKNFTQFFFSF